MQIQEMLGLTINNDLIENDDDIPQTSITNRRLDYYSKEDKYLIDNKMFYMFDTLYVNSIQIMFLYKKNFIPLFLENNSLIKIYFDKRNFLFLIIIDNYKPRIIFNILNLNEITKLYNIQKWEDLTDE